MKKLLFLMMVLTLSTACKKDRFNYKVESTTSDGNSLLIKVNGSKIYQGPFVETYEWEDTKDISVEVKVWKQTSGGAISPQSVRIVLKRGKKVLTETDEQTLLW